MSEFNFDLHVHVTTKAFLTGLEPEKKKSPWDILKIHMPLGMDEWNFLGDRLDSQSSLRQIKKGRTPFIIVPLHPMERDFASLGFLKMVALLARPELSNARLSRQLLNRIEANDKGFQSYDLLIQEWKMLCNARPGGLSLPAMVPAQFDENLITALISIEGGHSFLQDEHPDKFDHQNQKARKAFTDRVEAFFKLVHQTHQSRIAFLTLTHIGRGPLCTQAFAMARKENKIGDAFLPLDAGSGGAIRPVGWETIEICHKNGALIDLKHVSFRARCEYYQYVKNKGNKIPIIASHMGVAGMSFNAYRSEFIRNSGFETKGKRQGKFTVRKGLIHTQKGLWDMPMYPLALNLFDEEIRFIVDSKGLIGLSLDRRILGDGTPMRCLDFWSLNDYNWMAGNQYDSFRSSVFAHDIPGPGLQSPLPDKRHRSGAHYLCNNILRCVWAGGKDAWNCLTIGSDYDGMIDAIHDCPTIDRLPDLRHRVAAILAELARGKETLFHIDPTNPAADLAQKTENIFWGNGYRFFREHFSKVPASLL